MGRIQTRIPRTRVGQIPHAGGVLGIYRKIEVTRVGCLAYSLGESRAVFAMISDLICGLSDIAASLDSRMVMEWISFQMMLAVGIGYITRAIYLHAS